MIFKLPLFLINSSLLAEILLPLISIVISLSGVISTVFVLGIKFEDSMYWSVSPLDALSMASLNDWYFSLVVKFLIINFLSKYLVSLPSEFASLTIL